MTTQRQVLEPAEVADDRRQRRRDDRLVERGQEHAEHERGEDGHERPSLSGAVSSCEPSVRVRNTRSGGLVVGERAVVDRARAGQQERAEGARGPLGRARW